MGQRELDGQLNGKVDLSGPAAAPRLVAQWDLSTRSRRRDVGNARGQVEWTADGMDLRARVAPSEGDSLMLQGKVPLALSLATGSRTVSRIPGGTLSLDAAGSGIDISKFQPLFNPEKVGDLAGRLSLNAQARGSLEAPELSGEVVVQKAQVRISPLAKYRDGLVRLRLEGQQARIAEAHFRSGQGRLDLSGGLGLQTFPRIALDLAGKAQKFEAIEDDQLRASMTGDVHLGGDPKTPRLSGAVRLHDTDFYLQAKNLQSSAEPVELSSDDLKVLEQRFGPEIASRSSKPRGLLAEWGLGVDLSLGENVWLRRRSDPVMAVELGGQLQVRKEPAQEINVFGQIQPKVGRSFVQLMSRRFDLKTSDVTLNGPLKQARLGLEAEYRTTQSGGSTPVIITATVQSDTGKLAVKLGSRPVMRDADIISYLTTGRPASTDPTLASDEQGVLTT
ncbi:MAG TPA: translocation/assembly module TamB domain-containing protein, partial [Gemmatimonadales bacterium]